jgi:hypothetical protein
VSPARTGPGTAAAGVRSLHAVFELVLVRACPACGAPPGQPCAFSAAGAGADGAHLARFADARRTGLISEADMTVVLAATAPAFTGSTVVYDCFGGAP